MLKFNRNIYITFVTVKFFRRFCLILCAFSVFLNVTLSNSIYAKGTSHQSSSLKSKQIAFQKNGADAAINPFETEEDMELDEDGTDFDQSVTWNVYDFRNSVFTFHLIQGSKFSYFVHHERWKSLPLFIKYENLRI